MISENASNTSLYQLKSLKYVSYKWRITYIFCKTRCRLGILVDFFSHSTINGFMGGTAVILILQQLKGVFGMVHFSQKTNLIEVVKSIVNNRHEVSIEQAQIIFSAFLTDQNTKRLRYEIKLLHMRTVPSRMIMISQLNFSLFQHKHQVP